MVGGHSHIHTHTHTHIPMSTESGNQKIYPYTDISACSVDTVLIFNSFNF